MTQPTDKPEGLTAFQLHVAQLFFSLPASRGFLLAGGAALAAQQLTTRSTQDLDFFTSPNSGDVPTARDAFEAAALDRGWSVRRVRNTATFCRIMVIGQEDVFSDMLGTLSRFSAEDLPIDAGQVNALHRFFTEWAAELRTKPAR